jgi:hypothetical protein
MILIGSMNITRTRERGEFYCPQCGGLQTHRLRARRPFLTIYFIPVLPIGGAEVFVQCDKCRATWDETVLSIDKAQHEAIQQSQFRDEAIRSAILVALADGGISENEIATLLAIAETIFDQPLDREELGRLSSVAAQTGIDADRYVMTVSKRWNVEQRLLALQGMFLAATAGEETPSAKKMAMLKSMRDVLNLTETEFQTAIDDALQYDLV